MLQLNKLSFLALFLVSFTFSFGQGEGKDLLDRWDDVALDDSTRFSSGLTYVLAYNSKNPQLAIRLAKEIQKEARKKGLDKAYLKAREAELIILSNTENKDIIALFQKEFDQAVKEKKELDKAFWAYRVGQKNGAVDNFVEAVKYHLISLAYYKNKDDIHALALIYRDLNYIHSMTGEAEKSLETGKMSLPLFEELKDTGSLIQIYVRMAEMNLILEEYDNAYYDLQKGKKYALARKGTWLYAYYLNTLSTYHLVKKEYQKVHEIRMEVLQRTLEEGTDETEILSEHYSSVAESYYLLKNYQKALEMGELALETAKLDSLVQVDDFEAHEILAKIYFELGQFEKAYASFKIYTELNNEIFGANKLNSIQQQLDEFDEQERAFQDSVLAANREEIKNKQFQAKITQEKNYRYMGLVGVAILLILAGGIFYGARNKRKNSEALQEQMQVIEVQKKEIIDSIQYAKRIQNAILPNHDRFNDYLGNSFVLYLPKDIVAGDFYWMDISKDENGNETVYVAVADCTGHGVPGAMVSVVCNNSLKRAVHEYKLRDPGQILDKTRELVVEEFAKSSNASDKIKDGMDIALVSIEQQQEQEGRGSVAQNSCSKLLYAGAHNPLWIIRKDSNEVEVIKANKQPIGEFDKVVPFETKEVVLNPEDSVYLFSDGYPDQFGGESNKVGGKKLKSKGFKQLILEANQMSMEDQKAYLESKLKEWRGSFEQIDDVCVLGIKF